MHAKHWRCNALKKTLNWGTLFFGYQQAYLSQTCLWWRPRGQPVRRKAFRQNKGKTSPLGMRSYSKNALKTNRSTWLRRGRRHRVGASPFWGSKEERPDDDPMRFTGKHLQFLRLRSREGDGAAVGSCRPFILIVSSRRRERIDEQHVVPIVFI